MPGQFPGQGQAYQGRASQGQAYWPPPGQVPYGAAPYGPTAYGAAAPGHLGPYATGPYGQPTGMPPSQPFGQPFAQYPGQPPGQPADQPPNQHQGPRPQAGLNDLVEEISNGGNGLASLGRMLNLEDSQFWRGALIGAAAVLVLTNDAVHDLLFKTGAAAKRGVQSGSERLRQAVGGTDADPSGTPRA